MALFMMAMPSNSMPKPMIIIPMWRTRFFLMNRYMIAPTNRISGANWLKLNAVSCAVMVVPMLAPMITPIACPSVMRPELTKPMTITSVADEL